MAKNCPTEDLQQLREQTITQLKQLTSPGSTQYRSTEELAQLFHILPSSIRRALCVSGHYQGLVPIKLGNGRLIWPIA